MPFLREYMPEITCILPGEPQVIAVIPERDSSSIPARETAQAVMGIILEHVRFPGPSYRTIPRSPLPLYQLAPEIKAKIPLVASSDGKPPTMCIEMWAGCAVLSKEWVRVGFTGKAYECKPNGHYLPDGDITRPEVQIDLQDDLHNRRVYHSH